MTTKATDSRQARPGTDAGRREAADDAARLLVVLCTVADEEGAGALARVLVEERLAACVSRGPLRSTYRWKGDLVEDEEVLLVIKTEAASWPALRARIRELHGYECPEIVALEAAQVDPDYLGWLVGCCRTDG